MKLFISISHIEHRPELSSNVKITYHSKISETVDSKNRIFVRGFQASLLMIKLWIPNRSLLSVQVSLVRINGIKIYRFILKVGWFESIIFFFCCLKSDFLLMRFYKSFFGCKNYLIIFDRILYFKFQIPECKQIQLNVIAEGISLFFVFLQLKFEW